MSKEAERELAAFLAALPEYQRKSFESGISSLTQDEMLQWCDWITAQVERYNTTQQEYFRLLQRCPAKLKEYRNREQKENTQLFKSFLPAGKRGRKPNDELAERIWTLHDADKRSREIQEILRAEGRNLSTEAVEAYLKTRRRTQPQ